MKKLTDKQKEEISNKVMEQSKIHFRELAPIADSLLTRERKINFWNDALFKWKLNNVDYQVIQASGIMSDASGLGGPFFFDRMVAGVVEQLSYEAPKIIFNKPESERNWFKVGLLFASGEMETLKKQFKVGPNNVINCTGLAKKLYGKNYEGFKSYISESIKNDKINDKNIFSDSEKLLKIYNHCINNKIKMTDTFINAYKKLNPLE